ncbi:pyridine nucleotide-disulfide oxidoreductase [Pseudomonas viridiflava]|uniref:pyridine nucleotide-disulfide oxidoreductase n=1 Tax=Pseudomonas viridiflava TaxID=33069 RepID=UPI000F05E6B6|nr:pyridine nucleotide-disulfide oxidoreductase [Pseudomonas viridiflava]
MLRDYLETSCGCVVAGAGPAGMGLLFNALKSGTLPDLARDGLIIVDSSASPGTGSLGDYRITANSVGDVFLDCLRDPALRDVFGPLEHSPTYWRIRRQAHSAPQLSDVGELLAEASKLMLDFIVQRYGVKLWHSTTVTEVVREGDEFVVWVENEGRTRRIRSRTLVLNFGGQQNPDYLREGLADQGLTLPASTPIMSSDVLLRMNAVQLREAFAPALAASGRITVVGGSHSAFSMLENLADALEFAGLKEVTLVHRSAIRLFFESAELALAAGYAFHPVRDVCPVSGRVNRSSGLRYRALDVGREVLTRGWVGKTGVRVRAYQAQGGAPGDHEQAAQALIESSVVVQCTGYQPRLPLFSDPDGTAITLRQVKGGIDSDLSGCPLDATGQRMHGLHLFGIGAGLAADERIGSEPSFDGRIYGVWQFHNDASRSVIEALMTRLHQAPAETASHDRSLAQRLPFLFPELVAAQS